jgi:hypothetical protein
MKTLIVYEEKEELGSIILGINTNPNRKRFDDMVEVLKEHNVEVKRYDKAEDHEKYNTMAQLPSFEIDGELVAKGRYPQVFEVAQWFDIPKDAFNIASKSSLFVEANTAYGGPCCGLDADTYLDPNEE